MIHIDSKTNIKSLEEAYVLIFKSSEIEIKMSKKLS